MKKYNHHRSLRRHPSRIVRGWGAWLLLLALGLGACGSDDDAPAPPEPVAATTPEYLSQGTDQCPAAWVTPDYTRFGHTMAVQVQLGDTLAAYQGPGDVMCATIAGEVRAVGPYQETGGQGYFPLSVGGDGSGQVVSLHYFCHRLHRLYTIAHWALFTPAAAPTGDAGLYRPQFTLHYQ